VLDGLDEGDPEVVYYRSAASEPCTEPITQH
jgi:hypothetical protein